MQFRAVWNPELNGRCVRPAVREIGITLGILTMLGLGVTGVLAQDREDCAWVARGAKMLLPFACTFAYFQTAGNLYDLALVAIDELQAGWTRGLFVVAGGMVTGMAAVWVLVIATRLLPMTGGLLRRIDLVAAPLIVVGFCMLVFAAASGEVDDTLLEVTRAGSRLQVAWAIAAAAGSLYYGLGRLGEPRPAVMVSSVEAVEEPVPEDYAAVAVFYTRSVNGPLTRLQKLNRS